MTAFGARDGGVIKQFVGVKFISQNLPPAVDGDPVFYRIGDLIKFRAADGGACVIGGGAIADPGNAGAIPVVRSGVCSMISTAAQTRTLAAPTFVGQELQLCMDTDGGDIVLTVASAYNQAGNTVVTFNDAGDQVTLKAATIAGVLRWRLVSNDGCALS